MNWSMGMTKRVIVALLAITIQLVACSKLFIAMEPEGMAQSVGTVLRLFASNGRSNETEIIDRIVVQDVEEGSGLRSVFSIHPLALQKKAKPVFNYCIERKFANSYEIAIGLLRVGSTFDNDEHLEIIKVPIVENMYATSSTGLFTVDSMARVGFPIPIYVSSTQEVNYDVPDENNSELDDTEIDAVEIVAQKIPGLMGERSIVPLPCSIRLNGVSQFLTAAIIDSKFKGYPSVIIRPMFKTINRNVIVKQLTVLLASEDDHTFIQSELQVKRNTIDDSLKVLDTVTIAAKANESLVINRIIIRDEQKEETMEDVYLNQPIVMLRNSYGILTDWIVSEKFNKSKSLRFIALFDNIEYGMELTLPLENEFAGIGIIENSNNESQEQNSTEADESLNNQIFEGSSGDMMENDQKSITESTFQSQLQEADMEVPQFDHVDSLKTLSAQSLNRDTANDLDAPEGKVNSLKKKYRQVKRERSKSSFDFKDESKPVSNDSDTADSASLLSEEQMEPGVEKWDDVIKGTETQQENDKQQAETYQDNANEQRHEEITCIDNVTEGQILERAQSIKDLNSVSEPSECNEKPKESVSSNSSTETSFSNSQYEGNDNDSRPCDAQVENISDFQPECQAQSSLINIDESTEQSSLSECIADKLWHISNIQSKMPPKKYFVFKSTPTNKLFPLVVDVEDSGKLSKRVSARSILKIFPFDAGEEQMSVRECQESKSKHVANIIAHNAKDNYVVFKNTENNHLLPFTIDITPNIISEHYEMEMNNKNCENCQSREDGQAGEQDASIDKSFTEHSVERTGSTSSLSKESSKGSPTHNDEVANEARRLSKTVPKASISGISDIIEKFETSSSAQSSASVSSSRKVSTSAAAANVSKENTSRKDSSSLKGGNAFQNLVKTLSPVKATTDQLMERVAEGYVAKIIKNAFSVVTEKEKENVEQKRRPIYIKKAAKYEKEEDVRQDMDEEEGRQVMNEELDNSPLSEFQLKEMQQESELRNSENEIENDLQQQEVAVSRSVDQTLDVMDGAEQPKIEEQFEKESEHLFQTEEQLNVEDKLNDEKLLQNDQNLNGEELFQTEQPNLNEPLRIKEQPNVEEQSQNEEKLDPNEQNYVEEQLQSKELLHDEEQHNDESNYQNEEQHNDESNYQNEQQSQSNNTQNLNEQYPQLLTISTNAPKIAFNFIISATNLTSSPISIASIELLSNCDAFFNYPLQQPITIDPDTIASVFTCQLSEMFQYGDIVYVKAYDAEGLCVSNFYAAGIVAATDADFTLSVRQQLIDVGGMLEVYATSAIGTEVTWIRVYSDECDCTVEEHFDVPVPMHGNDSVKCIATIILPYDFVRCETIRIQAYSNSTALGTPITVQIASIVVDAIMDSYTVQVGVPFKVNVVTQQMAKIDLITIRSEGCDDVETIRVIPPIEIRSSECTLPPIVLSEAYSDVDAVKMQLWFNDMQILRDPIELQVECGRIQLDSVSREVYDDQIHSIDITGKSVNDATVSFDEVRAWVNDEKWNALIFTTAENSLMASTLHGANETVICTIQTQLLQLTTADSVNIQAFRNGKELSDTYVLPIIHVKPRVVGVELPEFDIEDEGLLVRSIKAKDTIQFVMKCHRTDYPSVTFRGISIVLQVPKDNDAIEGAATATNAVEEEVIFKEDIRYNLFATPEHSNAANSFQLNSAAQTDAFPIVPIYKWTVPFSMNNVGKVHLFLRYSADISDRFGNVVEICSRQREVTLNIVSSRASILSHFPLEHFDYAGLGHAIESTTAPSAPINIPESKTQEKQKTKRSTRFKKR